MTLLKISDDEYLERGDITHAELEPLESGDEIRWWWHFEKDTGEDVWSETFATKGEARLWFEEEVLGEVPHVPSPTDLKSHLQGLGVQLCHLREKLEATEKRVRELEQEHQTTLERVVDQAVEVEELQVAKRSHSQHIVNLQEALEETQAIDEDWPQNFEKRMTERMQCLEEEVRRELAEGWKLPEGIISQMRISVIGQVRADQTRGRMAIDELRERVNDLEVNGVPPLGKRLEKLEQAQARPDGTEESLVWLEHRTNDLGKSCGHPPTTEKRLAALERTTGLLPPPPIDGVDDCADQMRNQRESVIGRLAGGYVSRLGERLYKLETSGHRLEKLADDSAEHHSLLTSHGVSLQKLEAWVEVIDGAEGRALTDRVADLEEGRSADE